MRVGLDIGYGQTKIVFVDQHGLPQGEIHPSGVAPLALCPRDSGNGSSVHGTGVEVFVNGCAYGSLLDQDQSIRGMSPIHGGYINTNEYLALYYGALSRVEGDVVEQLITGIPVEQFRYQAVVSRLKECLLGPHRIQENRTVDVKKVNIVPQALGAYASYLFEQPADYVPNEDLLVMDFGHFSIDWITMSAGKFNDFASGSTLHGGSAMVDNMAQIIRTENGGLDIATEQLFRFIRSGASSAKVGGTVLDMDALKEKTAAKVAPAAINKILSKMRLEKSVNKVLLCGGAAPFFTKSVQSILPRAEVEEMNDAVLANALGYGLLTQFVGK